MNEPQLDHIGQQLTVLSQFTKRGSNSRSNIAIIILEQLEKRWNFVANRTAEFRYGTNELQLDHIWLELTMLSHVAKRGSNNRSNITMFILEQLDQPRNLITNCSAKLPYGYK